MTFRLNALRATNEKRPGGNRGATVIFDPAIGCICLDRQTQTYRTSIAEAREVCHDG